MSSETIALAVLSAVAGLAIGAWVSVFIGSLRLLLPIVALVFVAGTAAVIALEVVSGGLVSGSLLGRYVGVWLVTFVVASAATYWVAA